MRYLLLLFTFIISLSVQSSEIELVQNFIELSDATKVKGATEEDIEAVATLLSENMRYKDPKYGADLSKQEFLDGLRHWMGKAEFLQTNIKNMVVGEQAITVALISKSKMDGKVEVDEKPLMRLFEFKNGRVSLIKEYW